MPLSGRRLSDMERSDIERLKRLFAEEAEFEAEYLDDDDEDDLELPETESLDDEDDLSVEGDDDD